MQRVIRTLTTFTLMLVLLLGSQRLAMASTLPQEKIMRLRVYAANMLGLTTVMCLYEQGIDFGDREFSQALNIFAHTNDQEELLHWIAVMGEASRQQMQKLGLLKEIIGAYIATHDTKP